MTDLVERLRAYVACDGGDLADVADAADEIERLRLQVAALRESLQWCMESGCITYSHRVKGQNEGWCDHVDKARAVLASAMKA